MEGNRRDFLKLTSLAGAAVITGCSDSSNSGVQNPFSFTHEQQFNMRGYAAPALETVRVGIIGIGNRGSSMVRAFTRMEGVEIKAICDLEPERLTEAVESIQGHPDHDEPDTYGGDENIWKKVCERDDIDLIYICTPWDLHTEMAVYAMEHEKHAASERPISKTVDECWQLVETSERTRRHCCDMTQSSHHGLASVALNMVREGFFGDLVHTEGGYIHELANERYLFSKEHFHDMWRLRENATRNGNLYPESCIDSCALMLDINCGDKLDYMVSISSNDFSMGKKIKELAEEDPFFEPWTDHNYRGNMNVSIIRTVKGRTMMLQHDVSSPRPRPGLGMVSGTNGIFVFEQKDHSPDPRIATSHDGWFPEEEFQSTVEEYKPEITKRFDQLLEDIGGGHSFPGYSGYFRVRAMDWRLIDCLRNGIPVMQDVYDAALWSSIAPLSEWAVANRSVVSVPDFTSGAWETNPRGMDINLNQGGTTKLI